MTTRSVCILYMLFWSTTLKAALSFITFQFVKTLLHISERFNFYLENLLRHLENFNDRANFFLGLSKKSLSAYMLTAWDKLLASNDCGSNLDVKAYFHLIHKKKKKLYII